MSEVGEGILGPTPLLAQVTEAPSAANTASTQTGYAYTRPFVQPAPVWDYWYLLLIPLVIGISVVYKTVKCSRVKEIPMAALGMATWIILAFAGAAVGLLLLVRIVR